MQAYAIAEVLAGKSGQGQRQQAQKQSLSLDDFEALVKAREVTPEQKRWLAS